MIFDKLEKFACAVPPSSIGVVGAAAPEVLRALRMAKDLGTAEPILIGNSGRMLRIAADEDLVLEDMRIDDTPDDHASAKRAMELVKSGDVSVLMKGRIPTWILMQEGLKNGLRTEKKLLTHVTLIEVPRFSKPILVTDGALTPYPTISQKIDIIKNAVAVMRRLGVEEPRVAVLSASEEENQKIPCSIEAARLADMNLPGGELEHFGIIEGPLDLGCALDKETAQIKGVNGRVAGEADILVAPDIVSANLLSKSLIYLAGGDVAACVVGGRVPIAMVSRASPTRDKYNAVLLALACKGSM